MKRWAGIAAVGLAVASVVAYLRRRPGDDGAAAVVSATRRSARRAAMARFGARTGGAYAAHRARSVFASAHHRQRLDDAFALRTAEQVAAELGNLKGAMMKLGQMASYLDQGLPSPVRAALADLRQDAPPMTAELAAGVIEADLGRPLAELFAEWDPVPLASASIGQVHRAITHDDRAVAVKVRYPGVDEAIRADLDNVDALFGAAGFVFSGGLDPDALVAELKVRLVEELDYRAEAENQKLFVAYYRDHPFIRVPEVVDELCSGRVLTTELSAGARWEELRTWPQAEQDRAGEAIFRFVFRSLYRLHAFNGDPHPGNYLFEPGGRVTFLDFGLVKRFTLDEVDLFHVLIDAFVLRGDLTEFRRVVEAAGLLQPGAEVTDEQVGEWMGHFYEFVLEDRSTTITPEYSSRTMKQMFDVSGPNADIIRAANVPPSFVVIQRINLGLYAVLGELNATANWRRVADELWPFVDGPPSTSLASRKRSGGPAPGADPASSGGPGDDRAQRSGDRLRLVVHGFVHPPRVGDHPGRRCRHGWRVGVRAREPLGAGPELHDRLPVRHRRPHRGGREHRGRGGVDRPTRLDHRRTLRPRVRLRQPLGYDGRPGGPWTGDDLPPPGPGQRRGPATAQFIGEITALYVPFGPQGSGDG